MTETATIDQEAIAIWLVDRVSTELKIPVAELPTDRAFFELGLNSLNTLVIGGELAEFLHQEDFSPSLFWDYPTIDKLSAHLASGEADVH